MNTEIEKGIGEIFETLEQWNAFNTIYENRENIVRYWIQKIISQIQSDCIHIVPGKWRGERGPSDHDTPYICWFKEPKSISICLDWNFKTKRVTFGIYHWGNDYWQQEEIVNFSFKEPGKYEFDLYNIAFLGYKYSEPFSAHIKEKIKKIIENKELFKLLNETS